VQDAKCFDDLPTEILHKIRIALASNAAASLAVTSKAMYAAFQPRAIADHLCHDAAHPPAELRLLDNTGPAHLAGHFIRLISEAGRLPEELRPPVLNMVLEQASLQLPVASICIEHVALAYLLRVESIVARRCRHDLLCDFGRMLALPRFRQQCVQPEARVTPRPTVEALVKKFGVMCLALNAERAVPVRFPDATESVPDAVGRDLNARIRWNQHTECRVTDRTALLTAMMSGLFMLQVNDRVEVWVLVSRECEQLPARLKAPLLGALCATTSMLGNTNHARSAIQRSVQIMQDQDPEAQAMLMDRLSTALRDSHDRRLKDWGSVFLLEEINKLAPQRRLELIEPLVNAIPSLPDAQVERAFEIVLRKVFELDVAEQNRVLGALYQAFCALAPGPAYLAAFDRLWQAMPAVDPDYRLRLRNAMIPTIGALPTHVRPHRFFQAVGDAEQLQGTALSMVLPLLLSNVPSLGSAILSTAGFCDVATLVRRLPRRWQTAALHTLYEFVGRIPESDIACTFLNLLDRTAANQGDGERVSLIGAAATRAAWLPEPLFSDQLRVRVAQADALGPSMRREAYIQIVQALTAAVESAPVAPEPTRSRIIETIIARVTNLPLEMRVPVLAAAAGTLDRMEPFPERNPIRSRIVEAASLLPAALQRELRESLAAAGCRYLVGYL
jgi:hypothetical protein